MRVLGWVVMTLCVLALAFGCEDAPPEPVSKEDSATTENTPLTLGQAIAYTLAALIQEYDLHPEKDVVVWLATTFEWPQLPDKLVIAGDATVAYMGPVSGHRLILARGQTPDVFTVATGEGFDRDEFVEAATGYFELEPIDQVQEFGSQVEFFRITTEGRQIGYLLVNSGMHESIRGTGSVSFMSDLAYKAAMAQKGAQR